MVVRVLLVDNYDSFTFNLAQALAVAGAEVVVERHDAVDVPAARALRPTHLVISPGPGRPEDSGNSRPILEAFLGRIPVLGVCLGHQLLATVFGGKVVRGPSPVHGKTSAITHDGRTLFEGLPDPMVVGRYHSLVVERATLPADFTVSAEVDGLIMGMRHGPTGAEGVQFHPESVLTPEGDALIRRFVLS